MSTLCCQHRTAWKFHQGAGRIVGRARRVHRARIACKAELKKFKKIFPPKRARA